MPPSEKDIQLEREDACLSGLDDSLLRDPVFRTAIPMKWNYWKCRVSLRPKAAKRRWIVTVIETDVIVIRCGTWQRAVRKAIRFQHVQNRTAGKGWTIQNA